MAAAFLTLFGVFPGSCLSEMTGTDGLCAGVAHAAESTSAATIRLVQTEGTVSVKDGDGKSLKQMENMRLLSGCTISTKEISYAWMSLDDTKAVKLDALSSARVEKDRKKLNLTLNDGAIFFDVSEKLAADESFTISSSSMIMGIRGTIGWVRKLSATKMTVGILEGSTQVSVTDLTTGRTSMAILNAGMMAELDTDAAKTKTENIRVRKIERKDIAGFILADIAQGNAADGARRRFFVKGGGGVISGRIFFACGIDLRGLIPDEAAVQLREDQARASLTGPFDPVYYAARYKDVRDELGTDPAALWKHYRDFGQFEGRQPNAREEEKKKNLWKKFVEELASQTVQNTSEESEEESGSSASYSVMVSADPSALGTASADKTQCEEGEIVTLTATANQGSRFSNWTVVSGGVTLSSSTSTSATFTMGSSDVEIKAVFTRTYSLTTNFSYVNFQTVTQPSSYAEIMINGAQVTEAVENDSVTVSAHANSGTNPYFVTRITLDDGTVLYDAGTPLTPPLYRDRTGTFAMPARDVVITVVITNTG